MSRKPLPPETGRCSRCGELKPVSELNGYDPFKPAASRFTNAYCRRLANCKSAYAEELLNELAKKLR